MQGHPLACTGFEKSGEKKDLNRYPDCGTGGPHYSRRKASNNEWNIEGSFEENVVNLFGIFQN